MELGCSTLPYGHFGLTRALQKIALTGYKAIELCTIGQKAKHIEISKSGTYYESLKSQVADSGLAIESIGASGNLRLGKDHMCQVLDAAAAVNAPVITCGSGGISDDESSFKELVGIVNESASEGAKRGVKISLKPHVNHAVYSTDSSHRFMQEVDPEWVGINYDPTHLYRAPALENPEDTVDAILNEILTLRVRDVEGRQEAISPIQTQVAGSGDLDLPAIAAKVKSAPRVSYAVLELHAPGTENREIPVEEIDDIIQRSFDYLNPLFRD